MNLINSPPITARFRNLKVNVVKKLDTKVLLKCQKPRSVTHGRPTVSGAPDNRKKKPIHTIMKKPQTSHHKQKLDIMLSTLNITKL